jgi:hypothetical protein
MNRALLALLLALLIAAVLVAGCTPPSSAPASPSGTQEPTELPASTTPKPVPTVSWEAATVPAAGRGSASLEVTPGGDGLIAIGFDGQFGSMVWTSTGGHEWRDLPQPGFESAGLVSVVAFDGGLVAVGRGDTLDVDSELAAAWISQDGTSWRRVEGGPEMRGQMIDVVATDTGLFAVGGVPGEDAAGIWRSTDGEIWERTGGDFDGAFMWAIAEGGPGLVVSGWRRNPEPDLAVWTSADGVDWTLAPDPEGFAGFEGVDVIEYDGTLVMVGGSVFGGEARFWTSGDGLAWRVADVSESLVDATVRKLVATPLGLVALGGRQMDGAAWISPDGLSWAPFGESVPEAHFTSAYVSDDTLIVAGATQEGTIETGIVTQALIWTADLRD